MSPLDRWPEYAETVRKRLEAGAREYGDASFAAPTHKTLGEIEEELADVCGWAFVLWCRIRAIRETLPNG